VKYFGDSGQLANRPKTEKGNDASDIRDEYNDARIAVFGKDLVYGWSLKANSTIIYDKKKGDSGEWLLRSPGDKNYYRVTVDAGGSIYVSNNAMAMGIRPAMWVDANGLTPIDESTMVLDYEEQEMLNKIKNVRKTITNDDLAGSWIRQLVPPEYSTPMMGVTYDPVVPLEYPGYMEYTFLPDGRAYLWFDYWYGDSPEPGVQTRYREVYGTQFRYEKYTYEISEDTLFMTANEIYDGQLTDCYHYTADQIDNPSWDTKIRIADIDGFTVLIMSSVDEETGEVVTNTYFKTEPNPKFSIDFEWDGSRQFWASFTNQGFDVQALSIAGAVLAVAFVMGDFDIGIGDSSALDGAIQSYFDVVSTSSDNCSGCAGSGGCEYCGRCSFHCICARNYYGSTCVKCGSPRLVRRSCLQRELTAIVKPPPPNRRGFVKNKKDQVSTSLVFFIFNKRADGDPSRTQRGRTRCNQFRYTKKPPHT